MIIAQVCVITVALCFAAMGALALSRPQRILAVFGTRELTRDGRNEVRAVYGGFGLAIALLLLLTLQLPTIRFGALVAVITALAGMALGRLISALIDRSFSLYPRIFFALELALVGLLYAALHLTS